MSETIKQREEVAEIYKWKITDLFANDNLFNSELEETEKSLPEILELKNKITLNNIFEVLKLKDELSMKVEKLYVYANLKSHEDTTNSFYQALANKTDSLITAYSTAVSFINPEILKLNEASLLQICQGSIYEHYIDDLLREKEYVLTPEKEELMAQIYEISESPQNIYSMLNNADITFKSVTDKDNNSHELTHGKYSSFLESEDRVLRKSAFESYYAQYYKQKNTIATIYSSSLKKDVFHARARGYKNSLESLLSPTNIPVEVYHNLIDTVSKNLGSLHKYIDIRKNLLNLDELHFYDLYTPIVKDIDRKKTFDEAKEIIFEAFKPLGEQYMTDLKNAFNEGWIDIYENKGKRSGAYAWGAYGTHPFVSLNYADTISSMFTLAHEMGHAMHSFYTYNTQPYIYSDYTIFVAEVASTVNEALLMEHLLKITTDKNQRLYLINYFLEQFRGTFFRQTMFAEFELIVHEKCEQGEALTFDAFCDIYKDLNVKYYGSNIYIDEQIMWEWARIPHFYNAFYVYQYATGYSAAIALSNKILNENDSVSDYLNFLTLGSSDYSINLLKIAGVDMSSPQPIESAISVFENLLQSFNDI